MVGWRQTSWGYHAWDGLYYHGAQYSMVEEYGRLEIYCLGDVVGRGLDKYGNLFFTKNRKRLMD